MSDVKIFWDPSGFELDSLGKRKLVKVTDGDTPIVTTSIRMLSIDTCETHYPGNSKPSNQDANLAQLAVWIRQNKAPVNDDLADYLYDKLSAGNTGTLHENQGNQAATFFKQLLNIRLTKPNGKKRNLYLRSADEPFDSYGRLLAYISPSYTNKELEQLSPMQRATFNLLMVSSGWAASFPIYPSLPKYSDLILLQEVGKDAYDNNKGAWEEPNTLTGYEFRMCVKLYNVTKKLVDGANVSKSARQGWVQRFCIDMTTREVYFPQNYHKVKPYNRIFIWPKDVVDATAKLNLIPTD